MGEKPPIQIIMSNNLRVKSSSNIDETTSIPFKFNGKTYYGLRVIL